MIDNAPLATDCGCSCHCFLNKVFKTITLLWIFQTKTRPGEFTKIAVLGVQILWISVEARHNCSKTDPH